MIKVLTLTVAILMSSVKGFGAEAKDADKKSDFLIYQSSFVELRGAQNKSSINQYPPLAHWFLQGLFGETPTGKRNSYSADCSPQWLAKRMLDPRLQELKFQAALLQKYFNECESEVNTGVTSSLRHTLRMLSLKYEPSQNSFYQAITFHLPKGGKLQGLLGLKKDGRPRPMVVLRLGIFSSIDEFMAERYLAMQLFDQSPFNLLIIENMSSPSFTSNNLNFSFGGYDEGLQNILIAKHLRDSKGPFAKIVQSLHFVGVSLGGHGVLFASQLNQYNSTKDKLIDSFLLLCPVIQLKPSFTRLNETSLLNQGVDFWSRLRLKNLEQRIHSQGNEKYFLAQILQHLEARYQGALLGNDAVVVPEKWRRENSFWSLNNFASNYANDLAPVLSIVTEEDNVVPWKINSATIRHKNFKAIKLKSGQHCSLTSAYHWDVIATALQSYILAQSPKFKMTEIAFPVEVEIVEPNENLKADFKIEKGDSEYVVVTLAGKVKKQHIHLPLSSFGFAFKGSTTQEEEAMLVRWLHHNLRFKIAGTTLRLSWQL